MEDLDINNSSKRQKLLKIISEITEREEPEFFYLEQQIELADNIFQKGVQSIEEDENLEKQYQKIYRKEIEERKEEWYIENQVQNQQKDEITKELIIKIAIELEYGYIDNLQDQVFDRLINYLNSKRQNYNYQDLPEICKEDIEEDDYINIISKIQFPQNNQQKEEPSFKFREVFFNFINKINKNLKQDIIQKLEDRIKLMEAKMKEYQLQQSNQDIIKQTFEKEILVVLNKQFSQKNIEIIKDYIVKQYQEFIENFLKQEIKQSYNNNLSKNQYGKSIQNEEEKLQQQQQQNSQAIKQSTIEEKKNQLIQQQKFIQEEEQQNQNYQDLKQNNMEEMKEEFSQQQNLYQLNKSNDYIFYQYYRLFEKKSGYGLMNYTKRLIMNLSGEDLKLLQQYCQKKGIIEDQKKSKDVRNLIILRENYESIMPYVVNDNFDFINFIELIRKTNEQNNVNRGKDVIILLGVTGAGKSTTLNIINGCQPKLNNKGQVQFQNSICPVGTTGHDSCTFLVKAYSIDGKIYLDTPGKFDTNGKDLEIANQLSISLAFKHCRTVIPIIMLSFKDMTALQSQAIKLTIEQFDNLINNGKHLDKVLYSTGIMISKAEQKDLSQVIEQLKLSKQYYRKEKKQNQQAIVQSMIDKLEENNGVQGIIADPFDKNFQKQYQKFLDYYSENRITVQNQQEEQKCFKTEIPQKELDYLSYFTNNYINQIIKIVKEFDYQNLELIELFLSLIYELQKETSYLKFTKIVFDNCKKDIGDILNKKKLEIQSFFQDMNLVQFMQDKQFNKFMRYTSFIFYFQKAQQLQLNSEFKLKFDEYLNDIFSIFDFKVSTILNQVNSDDILSVNSCNDDQFNNEENKLIKNNESSKELVQQLSKILNFIKELKKKINQQFQNSQGQEQQDQKEFKNQLKEFIQKLQEEISQKVETIINNVIQQVQKGNDNCLKEILFTSTNSQINQIKIQQFFKGMNLIKDLFKIGKFIKQDYQQINMEQIYNSLQEVLEKQKSKLPLADDIKLETHQQKQIIPDFYNQLKQLKSENFDDDQINKIFLNYFCDLKDQITKQIDITIKNIKDNLKFNNKTKNLNQQQNQLYNMDFLIGIDAEFQGKFKLLQQDLIKQISDIGNQKKKEYKSQIKLINLQIDQNEVLKEENINKFVKYIDTWLNLQWIDSVNNLGTNESFFKKRLLKQIDYCSNQLQTLIKKYLNQYSKIKKIKQFDDEGLSFKDQKQIIDSQKEIMKKLQQNLCIFYEMCQLIIPKIKNIIEQEENQQNKEIYSNLDTFKSFKNLIDNEQNNFKDNLYYINEYINQDLIENTDEIFKKENQILNEEIIQAYNNSNYNNEEEDLTKNLLEKKMDGLNVQDLQTQLLYTNTIIQFVQQEQIKKWKNIKIKLEKTLALIYSSRIQFIQNSILDKLINQFICNDNMKIEIFFCNIQTILQDAENLLKDEWIQKIFTNFCSELKVQIEDFKNNFQNVFEQQKKDLKENQSVLIYKDKNKQIYKFLVISYRYFKKIISHLSLEQVVQPNVQQIKENDRILQKIQKKYVLEDQEQSNLTKLFKKFYDDNNNSLDKEQVDYINLITLTFKDQKEELLTNLKQQITIRNILDFKLDNFKQDQKIFEQFIKDNGYFLQEENLSQSTMNTQQVLQKQQQCYLENFKDIIKEKLEVIITQGKKDIYDIFYQNSLSKKSIKIDKIERLYKFSTNIENSNFFESIVDYIQQEINIMISLIKIFFLFQSDFILQPYKDQNQLKELQNQIQKFQNEQNSEHGLNQVQQQIRQFLEQTSEQQQVKNLEDYFINYENLYRNIEIFIDSQIEKFKEAGIENIKQKVQNNMENIGQSILQQKKEINQIEKFKEWYDTKAKEFNLMKIQVLIEEKTKLINYKNENFLKDIASYLANPIINEQIIVKLKNDLQQYQTYPKFITQLSKIYNDQAIEKIKQLNLAFNIEEIINKLGDSQSNEQYFQEIVCNLLKITENAFEKIQHIKFILQLSDNLFKNEDNKLLQNIDTIIKGFQRFSQKPISDYNCYQQLFLFGLIEEYLKNQSSSDQNLQNIKYQISKIQKEKYQKLWSIKNIDQDIKSFHYQNLQKNFKISEENQMYIVFLLKNNNFLQKYLLQDENQKDDLNTLLENKVLDKIEYNCLLNQLYDALKNRTQVLEEKLETDYPSYFQIMENLQDLSTNLPKQLNQIKVQKGFEIDLVELENAHDKIVKVKLNQILSKIKNLQNDENQVNKEYEQLNKDIKKFSQLSKYINQHIKKQILKSVIDFEEQKKEAIRILLDKVKNNLNYQQDCNIPTIADYFLRIQLFGKDIQELHYYIQIEIQVETVKYCKNQFQELQALQIELEKSEQGLEIVKNNNAFAIIQKIEFINKVKTQDLEYTLQNFKFNENTQFDQREMKKMVEEYEKEFKSIRLKYLSSPKNLVQEILNQSKITKETLLDENDFKYGRNQLVKLIAYVFAYWSIKQDDQIKIYEFKQKEQSIPQSAPHYSQIISIFSLFSLDQEDCKFNPFSSDKIKNALNEILTGEGKSITLGITSIIYSLIGFNVYCVSYSQYLSQRDYSSFEQLFKDLMISNRIKYGTFQEMCREIINQDENIREKTKQTLMKQCSLQQNDICQTKDIFFNNCVLLIDEVDVFFSENFFGNSYSPMTLIQGQEISDMIFYIWQNQQQYQQLNCSEVISQISINFPEVFKTYKEIQSIIEFNIIDMLDKLKKLETHKYELLMNPKTNEMQIAYIIQDTPNFQQSYGYLTIWAYAQCLQQQRISKEIFEQNVGLFIQCGSFSYAHMISPEQFPIIQGVTGTLQKVNEEVKKILKDNYKIEREFYCPSMFGHSKLKFNTKENHHIFLVDQIQDLQIQIIQIREQQKQSTGDYLPLLVVLEDNDILEKFYEMIQKNNWVKPEQCLKLQTKLNFDEKEKIISQATKINSFTLMSREFGRGSDFKCFDQERVISKGGVSIIQTFLSQDINEEIQIKGRVARQNNSGSFYIILVKSSPTLLQLIEESQIIDDQEEQKNQYKMNLLKKNFDQGNFYEFIDKQRNIFQANVLKKYKEKLQICHQKHLISYRYLDFLKNQQQQNAFNQIITWNSCSVKPLHVQIFIDDSGSMFINRWKKAVSASENFIKQLAIKFPQSYLSLIQFSGDCSIRQEFQKVSTQDGSKFSYRGGYTNFEKPFQIAATLAENYCEKCDNNVIIFYTDGGAPYPQIAVQNIIALKKKKIKFQIFLICETPQTVLVQMLKDIPGTNIQTNVTPDQLNKTLEKAIQIIEGQM